LLAVQHKGSPHTIYNVGNPGNQTSILGLANNIKNLCESSSQIELIDPQKRYGSQYLEAYNKIPAIERVVANTGWRPQKSLSEITHGLHRFYTHEVQSSQLQDRSGSKSRVEDSLARA
jgi:nucleoside-diphosphate-sugar epimerase